MPLLEEVRIFSMTRSSDRAIAFSGLLGIGLLLQAILEVSFLPGLMACFAFINLRNKDSLFWYLIQACNLALYIFGGHLFLIISSIVYFFRTQSLFTTLFLLPLILVSYFLSNFIQVIPSETDQVPHLVTLISLLLPGVIAGLLFIRFLGVKNFLIMFSNIALLGLLLYAAMIGSWVDTYLITSAEFRLAILLIPLITSYFLISDDKKLKTPISSMLLALLLITMIAGALVPGREIKSITFDESHGKWETTEQSYGPDDFGRDHNYTYSLLKKFTEDNLGIASLYTSEDQELPSTDSVFILKMPTEKFSEKFVQQTIKWVKKGGRLILIADHTDLYDTAQNSNFLLQNFGIILASNAVFDRYGNPNFVSSSGFELLSGRIDADNHKRSWQTGTSLLAMPINSIPLASYGMSYSQIGDYSSPNRFGDFIPSNYLPYTSHSAILSSGFGKGTVTVVLDSTQWSNFSFFQKQYQELYYDLISAQKNSNSIILIGLLMPILCILFFAALLLDKKIFNYLCLFLSALCLSLFLNLSVPSLVSPANQKGQLMVFMGAKANTLFLKQLIPIGERNYSRIISAMSKYGYSPVAHEGGANLKISNEDLNYLIIEPDINQLPDREEIFSLLNKGSNFTVLFNQNQIGDIKVQKWFAQLGISIFEVSGLAIAEDRLNTDQSILLKRGPHIIKDIRIMTRSLPNSLLKAEFGDLLIQSYSLRSISYPKKSGLISISFSSEQFSDEAIGDVWEGIEPTSLGILREKQFSKVVMGSRYEEIFPAELQYGSISLAHKKLTKFIVLKDGQEILRGDLTKDKAPRKENNASHDPLNNLQGTQNDVIEFIKHNCPKNGNVTRCKTRFLSSNLIEWMVTWKGKSQNEILIVELLHERRFADTGSTWNVIFGEK